MDEICENCKHYEPLTAYEGICRLNSDDRDINIVHYLYECLEWVEKGERKHESNNYQM